MGGVAFFDLIKECGEHINLLANADKILFANLVDLLAFSDNLLANLLIVFAFLTF